VTLEALLELSLSRPQPKQRQLKNSLLHPLDLYIPLFTFLPRLEIPPHTP
jgi:hypothetical protein